MKRIYINAEIPYRTTIEDHQAIIDLVQIIIKLEILPMMTMYDYWGASITVSK